MDAGNSLLRLLTQNLVVGSKSLISLPQPSHFRPVKSMMRSPLRACRHSGKAIRPN